MLDEKITFEPLPKGQQELIPGTIAGHYTFYTSFMFGHEVLVCFSVDDIIATPAQLQKHMSMLKNRVGMPAILIINKIAAYNLQRLVQQRVNFIVPQKQLFIPDLIIDLKKQRANVEQLYSAIPPIAQCLILFKLEKELADELKVLDIINVFDISYATANRALRWLCNHEIMTVVGGKEKTYQFATTHKTLWEKALPFLENPLERTLFTDNLIKKALKSGVNALSYHTLINEENAQHYAISKKEFKDLGIETDKEFGENTIEIWRYDPRILSDNQVVDKLSLYLTLKDHPDERIQIELENMINQMKW
jgi:hypothetical protein